MHFPFLVLETVGSSLASRGSASEKLGWPVDCGNRQGGLFAGWDYDGETLTAYTDPCSSYGLYYAQVAGGIAISSSPIALLAEGVSAEPNLEAIAVFHLLGYFIGTDTAFKNIRSLAGSLTWSHATGLHIDAPRFQAEASVASVRAGVQAYAELFEQAIARCGRMRTAPLVIPLSGGRDSRHILLECLRQGVAVDHCLTFDSSAGGSDPEVEIARELATNLGVQHKIIATLDSKFKDQWLTHGLTHLATDEHVQYLGARRYFRANKLSIFDGLAGDILSRNKSFSKPELSELIRKGESETAILKIIQRNLEITGTSFEEQTSDMPALRKVKDAAVAHIASYFAQFRDTADPYTAAIFASRTRREIALAPSILLSTAQQVFVPYQDPDLVDFCLSLPEEITRDGTFHDRILAATYPDVTTPFSDKVGAVWRRPSFAQRISRMVDAVGASRLAGPFGPVREIGRQAIMLQKRERARLYRWQTFHETLDSVSTSQAAASAYLRKLEKKERV